MLIIYNGEALEPIFSDLWQMFMNHGHTLVLNLVLQVQLMDKTKHYIFILKIYNRMDNLIVKL